MKELESLFKVVDVKFLYLVVLYLYGVVIIGLWVCKNRCDIIGMVFFDLVLGDCVSFFFIFEEM